jgi:hypothetical protein
MNTRFLTFVLAGLLCIVGCGKSTNSLEGSWEFSSPKKTTDLVGNECTTKYVVTCTEDMFEFKSICSNGQSQVTAVAKSPVKVTDKTFEIKEDSRDIKLFEGCPCAAALTKGKYAYKVEGDILELNFDSGEKPKFKRVK